MLSDAPVRVQLCQGRDRVRVNAQLTTFSAPASSLIMRSRRYNRKAERAAKAHRVTLRQNSIEYIVDEYNQSGIFDIGPGLDKLNPHRMSMPFTMACCSSCVSSKVVSFHEVGKIFVLTSYQCVRLV
jgi:hypothetical protein